ncbi:arsenate reductase [Herbaspirillum sp. Sphag1AN]|uniref:ArsC family reductase n=1 Tax=unclassified Herbaspirillum TaxID=2624150 RepID=UPI001622F678|nr:MULTISPECIES: ArsC family reductase [unclassified Herbaspirillum]MBB3211914.1 arsenate reductase [Herbaspirillum sp. Sphag1AN]MBB3244252.1 arsenate reductase [Herbaspirillum sp. Sphag64]
MSTSATTVTLYGIPNCDTVKKARTWLDTNGIAYTFHDFKKAGLDAAQVNAWLKDVPWDVLVNRKGTTWRALSDVRKAAIIDNASATALMLESPSVIKRPVLQRHDGQPTQVGFSDVLYQQFFAIQS